jgi:hypothetical protein
MSAVRRGLAVLAALLLAGCYTSNEPMIDKGEWAPLAGTFTCQGMPGQNTSTFTEVKSGFIFADYSYAGSQGETLKLVKIKDTLHVAQVIDREKVISYVYLDFLSPGQLIILAPDLLGKGPYIKALFDKHKVQEVKGVRPSQPGTANLGGPKANVLAFLTAHDKSLLTVFVQCRKAG